MLFQYETISAYRTDYDMPSSITIYNRDINNVELSNYYGVDKVLTIDTSDMDKIFNLLMTQNNLYEIQQLPSNSVLDGVQEKFIFSNGIKKVELITFNTNYYFDFKKEDVPESIYIVLDVFYRIAEVLRKYGIILKIEK